MTKVLVIDDNAAVRNTLRAILQSAGYEVMLAADGLAGCAAFHRERPDLIVTDIMLPEQEGITTIRKILREQPDAKIIAISGGARFNNVDFLQIARKFGAHEVFQKPFDPKEFLETAKKLVV